MPPPGTMSGTSDGSETSPTHDQHEVTHGKSYNVTLNYSAFYNYAVEDEKSSEMSLTEDEGSVQDPLNSSPARPSLLSCKDTYTPLTHRIFL